MIVAQEIRLCDFCRQAGPGPAHAPMVTLRTFVLESVQLEITIDVCGECRPLRTVADIINRAREEAWRQRPELLEPLRAIGRKEEKPSP